MLSREEAKKITDKIFLDVDRKHRVHYGVVSDTIKEFTTTQPDRPKCEGGCERFIWVDHIRHWHDFCPNCGNEIERDDK